MSCIDPYWGTTETWDREHLRLMSSPAPFPITAVPPVVHRIDARRQSVPKYGPAPAWRFDFCLWRADGKVLAEEDAMAFLEIIQRLAQQAKLETDGSLGPVEDKA